MLTVEAALFGAIVGLALGLTGGGGATLAVPLLVFGLSLDAPHAVAISLFSVGATSLAGFLNRLRRHEVDLGAGSVLAAGGILVAPVGAWVGASMPEVLLLSCFGLLVVIVSVRMWRMARHDADMALAPCAIRRRISWRCFSTLTGAGALTGLLSGAFGIGGGFVVVPAIIFATGVDIHRAVATSLMVVSIVSASALTSMLLGGRDIAWIIAVPFLAGSLLGLAVGSGLARWFSGPRLQQGFAVALAAVGVFVIASSLVR